MDASSAQERLQEQASRLYDLYERKSGRFHTALIGVTGLVTVVFVLIFYPYATFRGQSYALEARLESLGKELDFARSQAQETSELLAQYPSIAEEVMNLVGSFPVESLDPLSAEHDEELAALRSKIGTDPLFEAWLKEADAGQDVPAELLRDHPELGDLNRRPCFWRSRETWTRCMLKRQLDQTLSQAINPFGYNRLSHLRHKLFVPVHDSLQALSDSFGQFLVGSEVAWRVESAPVTSHLLEQSREYIASGSVGLATPTIEISGGLGAQYAAFSGFYRDILTAHQLGLTVAGNDFNKAVEQLERGQRDSDTELANIVVRLEEMKGWQNIETPFGTLPIGLNELTLLFPVLLAAGFMLCSSLFVESLLLRREFHRLTRVTDPDGIVLPDERIVLIAPLWIDPLQPLRNRIYRWSILVLPIVAYAVAIGLLLHNQLLSGPFLREARLNIVVYVTLYAGSVVLMVEGVRRVWTASRRYRIDR